MWRKSCRVVASAVDAHAGLVSGHVEILWAWLYMEVFRQDILLSQDCMAYGVGCQCLWKGQPMFSGRPAGSQSRVPRSLLRESCDQY